MCVLLFTFKKKNDGRLKWKQHIYVYNNLGILFCSTVHNEIAVGSRQDRSKPDVKDQNSRFSLPRTGVCGPGSSIFLPMSLNFFYHGPRPST